MKFFISVWICIWLGVHLHKLLTSEIAWMRYWAYGQYVLLHKWYVFQECLKLKLPLHIAILHDWDKFLPDEWIHYARAFYKEDGTKRFEASMEFTHSWLLHQNRNKHHWQYWMIVWGNDKVDELVEMPDRWRREMLADWRGAGRAITGEDNTLQWYKQNREYIKIHPDTREWIETQLGYEGEADV